MHRKPIHVPTPGVALIRLHDGVGPLSPARFTAARANSDPKFPWPHLALVQIHSAPAFRDKAKADANIKAFLDACPASFDGYERLARYSDDKNVMGQRAAQLRILLEKRSDIQAIGTYQTL